MIFWFVMLGLAILATEAGRRGRRAGAAGRRGRQRVWGAVLVTAIATGLATPWYSARVYADALSAYMESISHPEVPGGGVDATMAELDREGLDAVTAVADAYADGSREAMVALVREDLVPQQNKVQRWLDRGRFEDNMVAIMEGQEQRSLPLLFAWRYATRVCGGEPTAKTWMLTEQFLGEDSVTSKAVPADLMAEFKTTVEDRCEDVVEAVDREAISADLHAYETDDTYVDLTVDALLLRYEPGNLRRVEG